MEDVHIVNKQKINYTFKHDINDIYTLFKNPIHYKNLHEFYMTNFKCIKGKNSIDSVGSIFNYTWKNIILAELIVDSVTITNHYKMIRVKINSLKPLGYSMIITYKFFWISSENVTLFTYDSEINTIVYFTSDELKMDYSEKLSLIESWVDYFNSIIKFENHIESVLIDAEFNTLWNIITDFKLFKNLIPIISYTIDTNNNLIDVKFEDFECVYKIVKKVKSDYRGIYVLKIIDCNHITEMSDFYFEIIPINKKKCLVIIKHNFKEYISTELYKELSEKKRNLFEDLINFSKNLYNMY